MPHEGASQCGKYCRVDSVLGAAAFARRPVFDRLLCRLEWARLLRLQFWHSCGWSRLCDGSPGTRLGERSADGPGATFYLLRRAAPPDTGEQQFSGVSIRLVGGRFSGCCTPTAPRSPKRSALPCVGSFSLFFSWCWSLAPSWSTVLSTMARPRFSFLRPFISFYSPS